MKALDLIGSDTIELNPKRFKIHLASRTKTENPLDVFLAGDFDEWQSRQNRKNFQRPFVYSLIQLPEQDRWLFVGVYASKGYKQSRSHYIYDMERLTYGSEFIGRLIVRFARSGRSSYLNAEHWIDQMGMHAVLAEPMSIGAFPGYRSVNVSKKQLDAIVSQNDPSWRSALSSVSGVYLISDSRSGKHYVGSAQGKDGIWGRWCAYSRNGHGGNRKLHQLITKSPHGAASFRYAILEISDLDTPEERILARETYWKDILMSREHGLNAN